MTDKAQATKLLNLDSLLTAYRAYSICTRQRIKDLDSQDTLQGSELVKLREFLESEIVDLEEQRLKLLGVQR